MRRRVVLLRATALAVAAVGVLVGLTIYFSSESTPPCLISGVQKWQPPNDSSLHRYMVVAPDHALCFFDLDDQQQLVGYLALRNVGGIIAAAPRDGELALRYDRVRGALVNLKTGAIRYGIKPPLPQIGQWRSRSPDRAELWVLRAPTDVVHIFDERKDSEHLVARVKLTKRASAGAAIRHSNDGRFVYVTGAGDVIDAKLREEIANLEPLRKSRVVFEMDWSRGEPLFASGR